MLSNLYLLNAFAKGVHTLFFPANIPIHNSGYGPSKEYLSRQTLFFTVCHVPWSVNWVIKLTFVSYKCPVLHVPYVGHKAALTADDTVWVYLKF